MHFCTGSSLDIMATDKDIKKNKPKKEKKKKAHLRDTGLRPTIPKKG